MITTDLQKLEAFHLVFLRELGRSLPLSSYVLKGGSNLRFFFGSIRYSDDMDLDAGGLPVHALQERVMAILGSGRLLDTLRTYGIARLEPPNIAHAKHTETVQRFKVHLLTEASEDLHTKVEFSRRGFDSPIRPEAVSADVLAAYHMPPLIVPHYTAAAAARQKIRALLGRAEPQARDVFDLYVLCSQAEVEGAFRQIARRDVAAARDRIYSIEYPQYRDTVVAYLLPEDQARYGSSEVWDEIRLAAVSLLERANGNAR